MDRESFICWMEELRRKVKKGIRGKGSVMRYQEPGSNQHQYQFYCIKIKHQHRTFNISNNESRKYEC